MAGWQALKTGSANKSKRLKTRKRRGHRRAMDSRSLCTQNRLLPGKEWEGPSHRKGHGCRHSSFSNYFQLNSRERK
ncbi:hypothetical protein M5D96_006643 [Drosophila gunungcola]|uniref:Uncharacterized protein n=1 Tax=Drosophila gunungcola TaxID=103775 RepID=A0A9Q0BR05_9MUSC|nr:hypothetical protein M5D96_006643 [Drosophila gunungcola]